MFERVRMTFLPSFSDPHQIEAYNEKTGARIAHQIKKGGEIVQTIFWQCRQNQFPFWQCTTANNSDPQPIGPGEYTLTWLLEGKPFWEMKNVTVSTGGAADIYSTGGIFFDGPWDDYAYIYVANGNVSASPTFNIFFARQEIQAGKLGSKAHDGGNQTGRGISGGISW